MRCKVQGCFPRFDLLVLCLVKLPGNKTKIVCTVGPASRSPEVLEQLIRAGMNVARLNFSHADFPTQADAVVKVRAAAQAVGRRVAILADLPGPKMRIGQLASEPVELKAGGDFTLTGGFWFEVVASDCNEDGVVNLFDYDTFQTCLTGPGGGPLPAGCNCYDFDEDGVVTLLDFATMQDMFNGQ